MLANDESFDEQLPLGLQLTSSIIFTPIDVARHAATVLARDPGMRVLDTGNGSHSRPWSGVANTARP